MYYGSLKQVGNAQRLLTKTVEKWYLFKECLSMNKLNEVLESKDWLNKKVNKRCLCDTLVSEMHFEREREERGGGGGGEEGERSPNCLSMCNFSGSTR